MSNEQWYSQTQLGEIFGVSAITIGKHLTALGWKDQASATEAARQLGLARERTMPGGAPFVLWSSEVIDYLRSRGLCEVPVHIQDELLSLADFSADDAASTLAAPAPAMPGTAVPTTAVAGTASADITGGARSGQRAVYATDGACSGNPGPGGWAWVNQGSGACGSGGAAHTTNNIMELTAVLKALEDCPPEVPVLIRSDSQYVINVLTKWARGWARKGWKTAGGKPVANQELIATLMARIDQRPGAVDFVWVRGHAGDPANEKADALAVEQVEKHRR